MRKPCIAAFALLIAAVASIPAQERYKLPPKEVVRILDAPPLPRVSMNPDRQTMLLIDSENMPSISYVSMPILRVAGLRITPSNNSRQVLNFSTGLTLKGITDGKERKVALPAGSRFTHTSWSHDGRRISLARYVDGGAELWVLDALTGSAKVLTPPRLNLAVGRPVWMADGKRIIVPMIPGGRGPVPVEPRLPRGPVIQESLGKQTKVPTYEDLLKNPFDEALFDYYATAQIAVLDVTSGAVRNISSPGVYIDIEPSPDSSYVLVTRIKRPYSYSVPYDDFACSYEIWDSNGKSVRTLAELPPAEHVPMNGVRVGPREVSWQAGKPATLVWTEALDDGDPEKTVQHRDRIVTLQAPFDGQPREAFRLQHRFRELTWFASGDMALMSEYDWKRRWRTTWLVNIDQPAHQHRKLFDLSTQDQYGDPGSPVLARSGPHSVVLQDGDSIYLSGAGATPDGDRPFLDRMSLSSGQKQRLFQCGPGLYESFIDFPGASRESVIVTRESRTEVPNYFLNELKSGKRMALTSFKDPAPELQGVKKELVKYERDDGVDLSGTLYLPADYQQGRRLPVVIWAYPLEYSDSHTAGQVRGSPERFTVYRGASQLFFVTQGYAVFDNATMPVIGDPKTMNDTYGAQIVANARAAIDVLDRMGVADRTRIGVGGHSYGAFMTANLLAHCDLFAAGIARSGAYNRTLTPFGFQSERRTLWEARETYINMSPFMYADRIKTPLLLIHGMADNNSGTFPIQSERLFAALKGFGATARFVYLPCESHGYSARESILTVLAEMFDWFDTYVKKKAPL